MKTVSDIAIESSRLLNDSYDGDPAYNFTRWSKDELEHYASEAISMIVSLRPKKFIDCVEIELSEGTVQKLPDHCTLLTKILDTSSYFGTDSSTVPNEDNRIGSLFSNSCSDSIVNKTYKVEGYTLEESSTNIFYITPPVPKNQNVKVRVLCTKLPKVDSNYIPEFWMHNAIVEWVLYKAYLSEDESANAPNNAQMHLEHFYAIIKNVTQAEENLMANGVKNAVTN